MSPRSPTWCAPRCVFGQTASVVGEVRGAEALDMLKAWNTGHPGGITTLHANSALAGLYRLEQLIQEADRHRAPPIDR
ncbi:MAG: hypothetical protein AcusKO_42300 [Acuticoccus sp.]